MITPFSDQRKKTYRKPLSLKHSRFALTGYMITLFSALLHLLAARHVKPVQSNFKERIMGDGTQSTSDSGRR